MTERNVIKVKDLATLHQIMGKLEEFQSIHNELRKDFLSLYKIADENTHDINVAPLGRACVKELFALIEADIYLMNQFNPYNGYEDMSGFNDKFKKTFKHHSATFNKEDIYKKFIDKHFKELLDIKTVRDNTTHPKDKQLIYVNREMLIKAYTFYNLYTAFVSEMMTNVFIQTTLPITLGSI